MSHLVYVEDPWFGPYIMVQAEEIMPIGVVSIIIGPLYQHVLRIELLNNQGDTYSVDDFKEKPCQHDYVDGRISGVVPELPLFTYRDFWVGPRTTFKTNETDGDPGLPGENYRVELEMDWIESKVAVDVRIWIRYFIRDPGEQEWRPLAVRSCNLHGLRREDWYSGAVRYEDLRISGKGAGSFTCTDVVPPWVGDKDNLLPTIPSLFRFVSEEAGKGITVRPDKTTRDACIYAAVDDMTLANLNWIETLPDLKEPLAFLKQLRQFLVPISDFQDILKRLASLHLFWKYVVKTGIMTWKEIGALMKWLWTNHNDLINQLCKIDMIGRAREYETIRDDYSTVTVTHNVKLCYGADTSSLNAFLSRLGILRLTPRLVDLWDVIPYSFVIDWIIPLADAVDNIEKANNLQRLPFKYMLITNKFKRTIQRKFTIDSHEFEVDLTFVNYKRKVHLTFPSDVWLGVRFKDPRKQSLTATALIVQRFL